MEPLRASRPLVARRPRRRHRRLPRVGPGLRTDSKLSAPALAGHDDSMGPGGLPARALLLLVSHWAVAAGGHFPVPFSETAGIEGCHCWAQGTDCRCFGDSVLQIPADLGDRVEKL